MRRPGTRFATPRRPQVARVVHGPVEQEVEQPPGPLAAAGHGGGETTPTTAATRSSARRSRRVDADQVRQALPVGIACVQNAYNLLDRMASGARGLPGVTAAQVGLAWLLAHYERTLLIPGTADPAHLVENLGTAGVRLGPDAIARLDALVG